jgi:hypothetical protein
VRHNAVVRFVAAQRKNRIKRASCLERSDFLEVFALKEKFTARALVQNAAYEDGCVMDEWSDALVRLFDGLE